MKKWIASLGMALVSSLAPVAHAAPVASSPVAVAGASTLTVIYDASDPESGTVTFDHSASYHEAPWLSIIDFEWLFDLPAAFITSPNLDVAFASFDWGSLAADTYSADGRAYRSSWSLAQPQYTFTTAGPHFAALRVVDNSTPMKVSFDVLRIDVVAATVAEPGSLVLALAGAMGLFAARRRGVGSRRR